MSLLDDFNDAQQRVQTLESRPSNETLLELYGLYKQGSLGDVQGKRPGRLNIKARAKYDAWASREGMSKDDAMKAYVKLVDRLVGG